MSENLILQNANVAINKNDIDYPCHLSERSSHPK